MDKPVAWQNTAMEWHLSKDGLPPIGSVVIGGFFYKDTWLKDNPEVFEWGQCRVIKDNHPDFPNGKRWHTFGPSHNEITHWCWPPQYPQSQSKTEKQEPVAWEHLKAYGYAPGSYMMTCRGCNIQVIDVDKRAVRCRSCAEVAYAKDTHPQPKSEWVGLTDGELNRLYETHHDNFGHPISASQNGWSYERAIEARLKEKNNG